MRHYLFEDRATGEEFIVGAMDIDEANLIAKGYFEDPECCYRMSEYEAEASGLDEY